MVNEAVDQAVKELKAGGVRITPQRYAILEYLIEYRNHPTADEIFRSLEEYECGDRLQQFEKIR